MVASTSGASLSPCSPGTQALTNLRRVNNKLVLSSSSVYYRNAVLGGANYNGTAPDPITLIDYDSLPDTLVIPNGGFKSNLLLSTSLPTSTGFTASLVTKVVATATSTPTHRGIESYDHAGAKKRSEEVEPTPIFRMARRVVDLEAKVVVEKRAVTTALPIGFMGMMVGASPFLPSLFRARD